MEMSQLSRFHANCVTFSLDREDKKLHGPWSKPPPTAIQKVKKHPPQKTFPRTQAHRIPILTNIMSNSEQTFISQYLLSSRLPLSQGLL